MRVAIRSYEPSKFEHSRPVTELFLFLLIRQTLSLRRCKPYNTMSSIIVFHNDCVSTLYCFWYFDDTVQKTVHRTSVTVELEFMYSDYRSLQWYHVDDVSSDIIIRW